MGGFDYNRMGELRIRAERADARAERMATAGDALIHAMTPAAIAEWQSAKTWDGTPDGMRPRGRRNPEDLIRPRPAPAPERPFIKTPK